MGNRKNVVHINRVRIEKSSEEDALEGWVRIPENIRGGIKNGCFVKIRANNRTIFCQVRGTPSTENVAFVNEHYRDLLGIKAGQELDLDIAPRRWFFGKVRALTMHPQHLVRFGFGFSLVAISLGLLSLIIALLPFAIRSLGGSWAWAGWVSIASTLAAAWFIGYFIKAAISTFKD